MTKEKNCGNCANYAQHFNHKDCGSCLVTHYPDNTESAPSNWKAKPMTNGDRIRAMSDKELAGFLAGKFTDFSTIRKVDMGEIPTATAISAEAHLWFTAWMQWLRMSVEEKENEDFLKRVSRM